jgi:hypothetical protein
VRRVQRLDAPVARIQSAKRAATMSQTAGLPASSSASNVKSMTDVA